MTIAASGTNSITIPSGKMYFVVKSWSDNVYQLQVRCNGTSSSISWSFAGPARCKMLKYTWNDWWGARVRCWDDKGVEALTLFIGRNYTSAASEERDVFLRKSLFDFPTISI